MEPEIDLGITALNNLLKQAEIDLDAKQMADLLWLAVQMGKVEVNVASEIGVGDTDDNNQIFDFEEHQIAQEIKAETSDSQLTPPTIKPATNQPKVSAYLRNSAPGKSTEKTASEGIPFQAPAAPGLRNKLALARALRPLMRKVPSQTKTILDEEETVTQIAERGIWTPVLKPAPERWLELALVVEDSRSIEMWQEIIAEFHKLTELQGAFRDVRTWSLKTDNDGEIKLFPNWNLATVTSQKRPRSPKELLDPTGRRLIILISDCISPIWRQGKIHNILKLWSKAGAVAIFQLLPERSWGRTALGAGFPVQLSALVPGVANTQLIIDGLPVWQDVDINKAVTLPVVTLEPDSIKQWSRVVAGVGSTQTAGISFELSLVASLVETSSTNHAQLSATDLVKRFRTTASPTARRLAGLMASVPVSLPVVYLIQETLLKESMQVHVAEVFMSGLFQPINADSANKSEIVQYEFVEGIRDLLIDSVPIPDVEEVLDKVSQFIARKVGLSIKNFAALLSPNAKWDEATQQVIMPFARITSQVLRRLGGEYAALAEKLEGSAEVARKGSDVSKSDQFPPLQPFQFEVATIELKQTDRIRKKTELIINRRQQQAQYFSEDLGNDITLEMVAIPGGTFLMGSPETEKNPQKSESPQHQVSVKPFFMGKYAVTQAQWKAVAALPQINSKLNPDPSRFKGAKRPVEQVSWHNAVEFCARLSKQTGRPYRLPSEAEWEYACRANTTTPFHFGETITTDLANYDGNYIDGSGSKGKSPNETTPVGSFGVANDFGLYDMHGNVWEWCADSWHSNYKGAPSDGSVWESDNDNDSRLLRGGSWDGYPVSCRSAYRGSYNPGGRDTYIGFRLVYPVEWTL
jgi:formylglycine-generating enzyme required for sulfatase activity